MFALCIIIQEDPLLERLMSADFRVPTRLISERGYDSLG